MHALSYVEIYYKNEKMILIKNAKLIEICNVE